MIRNVNLFILGLLLVTVGAILRHQDAIGLPRLLAHLPTLPGVMLNPKSWVIAGGVCILISMVAGVKLSGRRKRKRDQFEPVSIERIGGQITEWSLEAEPDIPLIVDYIVYQAIKQRASDIHFDPGQSGMAVKYRLQGMMKSVAVVDKRVCSAIVNRLKVLSNLVIYKDHVPQDGRFDRNSGEAVQAAQLQRSGLSKTDFRIAFMPTLHGERIVIRILGARDEDSNLASLGMDSHELTMIRRLVAQPQGMIILTGPTGSGKTTTIFAALNEILEQSHRKRSIATLEDPIEFDAPDINQSQVDETRNFTFEKGLRAILRQDPDVIMVGEIRDGETAKIAIQAGMTGHLLITTVHANTSAAAFSRLAEMGIPAYSLNSAVTAVIAQRLVRNICPHCKTTREFTDGDLHMLGVDIPPVGLQLHTGSGCPECEHSGYKGRTAIFEILEVNESIRKLISQQAGSEEIYQFARKQGLRTLWETGIDAVQQGITTLEEVDRTIASTMR
ncbi:MAG: type II/IV secretion system protein [Deltaproteobacteria bacterium]|nr:type II/IV secretion system protein [Deltaproteobacteria bacterium]MBN2672157.1 type II/IV secretion system protein [Deltaproteobacteria bacterium]